MKYGYIYMIKNKINDKVYIGQTFVPNNKRLNDHKRALRANKHDNTHLQNSWNKYKEENFEFSIIEKEIEIDLLTDRENFWISHYDSINGHNGFNKREAGNSGLFSEESKRKISKTGQYHTKETKEKISKTVKKSYSESNKINPRLGVKLSDDTKQKIRNALKGKTISEETKKKISKTVRDKIISGKFKSNKGLKMSKQTRDQMSKSATGRTHSNDTKQKIGSKNRRLSDNQVIEILNRLKNKERPSHIHKDYNVSIHTIIRIRDGIRYNHIPRN